MKQRIGILTGGGDCPGLECRDLRRRQGRGQARLDHPWHSRRLRGSARPGADPPARLPRDGRPAPPRRHRPQHVQQRTLRRQGRPWRGQAHRPRHPRRGEEELRRPRAQCAHRGGRRRLALHRPAVPGSRHPGRRRAQDHRQRPGRHGGHVRLRHRRVVCHRCAGPPQADGDEPQPRHGGGDDGPLRRLDRGARRHRRRGQRHPSFPRSPSVTRASSGRSKPGRPRENISR